MAPDKSETDPSDAAGATTIDGVQFGDDALGKVQGILFGDHARQTLERIDTLEQALLGVVGDLRTEVHDRLDAIDARIDAEAETRATAQKNLGARIDEEAAARKSTELDLGNRLQATAAETTAAIDAVAEAGDSNLAAARDSMEGALASLGDQLREDKVDRTSLAELLRRTADEIAVAEPDQDRQTGAAST